MKPTFKHVIFRGENITMTDIVGFMRERRYFWIENIDSKALIVYNR